MNTPPLVSICIPTYNRAGIIRQTIESALQQTYKNIEVLVVDNASTDNTPEIIQTFSDPRLKFFPNKENTGIFGNFNRCIDLAKGQYIHILHSDDYIDPSFTQTCVHFFEEHPDVSLTFTSARFTSEDNRKEIYSFPHDHIFTAPEGFRQMLMQKISIICPSVMVRREVYEGIGKFSPEYPYASDYYQWLTISRKYTIAYIRDAWINYRIGDHSETYNYLFRNPMGYLDVLKIYVRLLLDLEGEREKFSDELNFDFYQFIKSSLSAGFLRSDQMPYLRASFFSGVATSSLALVNAGTLKEKMKKTGFFVLIQISGILMSFSIFRKIGWVVLSQKKQGY